MQMTVGKHTQCEYWNMVGNNKGTEGEYDWWIIVEIFSLKRQSGDCHPFF